MPCAACQFLLHRTVQPTFVQAPVMRHGSPRLFMCSPLLSLPPCAAPCRSPSAHGPKLAAPPSLLHHRYSIIAVPLPPTAAPRKGCICACMRECDRGVDPPLPCDQPAATPWPAQAGPLVLAPLEELPPPALLLLAVGARHLVRLAHDRLRVCHAHCLAWLVGHLSSVSVGQTS